MIQAGEVAGIPAYSAPLAGDKVMAGLVFRVGRADETLATHGVTHLVEHLALDAIGLADYKYNGAVSLNTTHMHAYGTRDEVLDFLTRVCTALQNLPTERLEKVRDVVETESHAGTLGMEHAVARFGPHGVGLGGYREFGVKNAAAGDVQRWAARYFTADNAAVWFAGMDIPDDLRLPLPPGDHMRVRAIPEVLTVTPAYFTNQPGAAGMTVRVRRDIASWVFAATLDRMLFRKLRHEQGLSYSPGTSYEHLDGSSALLAAKADLHPENQDAAIGAFLDVVAALQKGKLDEGDVRAAIRSLIDGVTRADYEAEHVPTFAEARLVGGWRPTIDELVAGLSATTRDDVASIARTAMRTALVSIPPSPWEEWVGIPPVPATSGHMVAGRWFWPRTDTKSHMIIGDEGVTMVRGGGPTTVRYDACAGLVVYQDGALALVGDDALVVTVEPTIYRVPADTMRQIRARVGDHIPVERDPGSVPQPRNRIATLVAKARSRRRG